MSMRFTLDLSHHPWTRDKSHSAPRRMLATAHAADAAGIDVTHVAYKGEGPAYADLLAGVVQMAVGNINAIHPLLKTGKIRAVAVTGKDRVA
ncbi:MAG: tripartite tricarboxylate transporter substrate-binding protein, partial [Actinomycetes bacterium]